MARTAAMVASVLALVIWSGAVSARTQATSTADGVYTAEQAAAGKDLYAQVCEGCHQPAKFTGAEFRRAYGSKPLSEIDGAMVEMPADNPGSLTREDVAALIAYFLSMNDYPAGQTPLSGATETLKSITVAPRP
jgi:mono/diheme cytochrome c family protein